MTRRFWIGLALALPVDRSGDGRPSGRQRTAGSTDAVELDPARVRDAGGALGRLAVLRARLAIAGHPQSQHVHADRDGHRRRLSSTASSPPSRPAYSRQPSAGHDGAVAVYFEAAAVITVLVLLGQVLELRAREATSGAIKALLDLAPKTARRIDDDGADHEVAARQRAASATGCGCGPARRCRWTASSSKAAPRSTNRW